MKKVIAISLSPNTTRADVLLALRFIFSPWLYLSGSCVGLLEQWFKGYFDVACAIAFNSGRSSFFAILKALDITKNDEVIIQAFTCVVVPNTILALGAKPVYVDIQKNLTMDPHDLKRKISHKTKVIVVQHTLGIPSSMQEIIEIAKTYNIPVIEDVAHTVGGTYQKHKLGTIGIAGFFSFGRDKAFSSVYGGVVITNNELLGKKIQAFRNQMKYPRVAWVVQQLFHPIAFAFILPIYNIFGIGKILLVIFQQLSFLSFPVTSREKSGIFEIEFVQKMPNALAGLALQQLQNMEAVNRKRILFVDMYQKELSALGFDNIYGDLQPLLRYPILTKKRDELVLYLKQYGVYAGKWYSEVIDPKGSDLKKVGYVMGSCIVAEETARTIINLPTHPRMNKQDVEYIINLLKIYAKH